MRAISLLGIPMFRTTFTAVALATALFSLPSVAGAQSLVSAASVDDLKAAVVAAGAKVTKSENGEDVYVEAEAASGMKFTVEGRACNGAAGKKRCDGVFLDASFDVEKAKVEAKVKEIAPMYAAIAVLADGDDGIRATRYLILDHGVARDNLKVNFEVFISIAEAVWDKL